MKNHKNTAIVAVGLILIALMVYLSVELSQAWRNERFLDAELNKQRNQKSVE